jgi:glycosyltransferase involved in cell wall biosynthesis
LNSKETEVSVVIPCLDESRTVGACVRKAIEVLARHNICGEVILADNGSVDGSREEAAAAGARVVTVALKGYGSALAGGIAASHGAYIIMGDADGSYDFGEIPQFVDKLRAGFDLVQGCRFPKGGGQIEFGAMPFMHRWIGNPALTMLARFMFGTRIHDIYCGLRGFTRSFYDNANLRCTGMEFATEMIIKAAQMGVRTAEMPIILHRDGRSGRRSHLRTFRDGWLTVRLFLLCSPDWLFLVPGIALALFGVLGSSLSLAAVRIGPATLGVHSLLVSSLLLVIGTQCCFLGIFAHTFALVKGLRPPGALILAFYQFFNLEKALLGASLIALFGITLVASVFMDWSAQGFGLLNYPHTLRLVIPGVTLLALAAQIMFSSFMVSILSLASK